MEIPKKVICIMCDKLLPESEFDGPICAECSALINLDNGKDETNDV